MRRFVAAGGRLVLTIVFSYLLPLTSYLFLSCGTAQKPVAQTVQAPVIKPLPEEQQRKYDQFFLDAILEREKGHSDAAFDLLRHCLDINPNASEVHYFLAQYYNALDADYRGEIGVVLINLSQEDFVVEDGERIAQMVIARHEQADFEAVEVLDETVRGEGGYGHTGVK